MDWSLHCILGIVRLRNQAIQSTLAVSVSSAQASMLGYTVQHSHREHTVLSGL
jgi:hypothetical protein